MFVIGITGPSGAGKGEVSRLLSAYGACVIDADKVYHKVINPPSKCLDELIEFFGDGILQENGCLDRKALGRCVFGDENRDKLEKLNNITHKYVVENIRRTIEDLKKSDTRIAVIDAPLLIEAGLCSDCDMTIAVLVDKDVRAQRISARDGIDRDAAMVRINSQKADEYYISSTDALIHNDADIGQLSSPLEALFEKRGVKRK
jgi:dephospho-CoA kinase